MKFAAIVFAIIILVSMDSSKWAISPLAFLFLLFCIALIWAVAPLVSFAITKSNK